MAPKLSTRMPRALRLFAIGLPVALLAAGVGAFALGARSGSAGARQEQAFDEYQLTLRVEDETGERYTVAIQLLSQKGADNQPAIDELVSRFPGAVVLESYPDLSGGAGVSIDRYVLNSYRWSGSQASWQYNASGAPTSLANTDTLAVGGAAAAWSAVGANFAFLNNGPTIRGTGGCNGSRDGFNVVGWKAQAGATLAVTCTWYSGTTALEFDMQLDPDWAWTTGSNPSIDLQSVAAHEFGHALGLGHSADSSALMYYAYSSGTLKRVPRPDDIAGAIALYGSSGSALPPATQTTTATPSATATKTSTPTPTATATTPGRGRRPHR